MRAKRAAKKAADFWWHQTEEPLLIGEYSGTRLQITEDSIRYIAGQYTPTEIWWAVEDYFLKFRQDCREQSGVTEAIEKAVKAVENQFKKS